MMLYINKIFKLRNKNDIYFIFIYIENILEELPPGQQAISSRPIKYTGGREKTVPTTMASAGSSKSCPPKPVSRSFGLSFKSRKSFTSSVRPSVNIRIMRIGSTISMVSIDLFSVKVKKAAVVNLIKIRFD